VVLVMDRDRVADYQRFASELREAGIKAEMYLGGTANFGKQLKYAEKRDAPLVVIQGADEKARGEVQIKPLVSRSELAASATDHEAYLSERREAQISVPREGLVEAVKEMLGKKG
jgi:histidyl-tRNA synthetase